MENKLVIFDLDRTLHDDDYILGDDIIDILKDLKMKNIKIALASLNSTADHHLYNHGIEKYFDVVAFKNWRYSGSHKTDLFEYIWNKLNTNNNGTLFNDTNTLLFDDSLDAITQAQKLQMKTIHVDYKSLLTKEVYTSGLKLLGI